MAVLPPNIVAAYGGFKDQQQQQFQRHKQFADVLEQRKAKVEKKQGDLDIAGRLIKALDPSVAKSARTFLLSELAGHVGVDPKSEYAQNVNKMIMGLDPDSMQAMRMALSQQLEGAEPGQITDMTKGILTGQIDMNSFVGMVQQASMQMAQQGGEQPDPNQPTMVKTQTIDPNSGAAIEKPQPFQPGQPGNVGSFEGQRTVPPDMQPANPQLIGALGLAEPGKPVPQLRTRDLLNNGLRVPLSPEEQQKAANDITERSVGINQTLAESAHITDLFAGRPETLGVVGAGARGFQSAVRQVEGLGRLLYQNFSNEADPYSQGVRSAADAATKRLVDMHGIDKTAIDSARIQSSVLGLAYRMAIARGIPGGRLTNAIIEQHLAQLGQSGSPEQFQAVVQDTNTSILREFDDHMRRSYGISGYDIIIRQMSDQEMNIQAQHIKTLPVEMAHGLLKEDAARKSGNRQVIQPSSPTLDEERTTLGTLETQKKTREQEKLQQDMTLDRAKEERAERSEGLAESREERLVESTEQQRKLDREKFDYQQSQDKIQAERDARNAELAAEREQRLIESSNEAQEFQREKFEYEKQQDKLRTDKAEQERVSKIFQNLGAAIAQAFSGGGSLPSYNPGPGQDVNAFRITPAPQRTPPRPGGQ